MELHEHEIAVEPQRATKYHKKRLSETAELGFDGRSEDLKAESCSLEALYNQISDTDGEVFDERLENPERYSIDDLADFMESLVKKEPLSSVPDSINTYEIINTGSNIVEGYTVTEAKEFERDVRVGVPFVKVTREKAVTIYEELAYVSRLEQDNWEVATTETPDYFL